MGSIVANLLSKIFGKKECRALMVGLDASGRTTALYRMKLGEVVTTIPTIGFNVEIITYRGLTIDFWDVGGCDKIRPLWRHYFMNTNVVCWFVDSNDRERIDESAWSLGLMLAEDELRDASICVFANKQDLSNSMSINEIKDKLGLNKLRNRRWHIQPCVSTDGYGLYEALDWIVDDIKNSPPKLIEKTKEELDKEEKEKSKKDDDKETILIKWLEIEDESDEEFIDKLLNYTLNTWDHRVHLRIAWVYLTREGRKNGMKLIFDGIRNFIKNSKISNKRTFHETMTYFWVHMVHYAIEATNNPTNDFKGFLIMNPQLSNSGLWLYYYNKDTMLNNPESRSKVVLPDIHPLPSIIHNTMNKNINKDNKVPIIEKDHNDTDDEFISLFNNGKLPKWNHDCFIRVIWIFLKKEGRRNAVTIVMDKMKSFMKSGFHFTITYFWIQMVDLYSRSYVTESFHTFWNIKDVNKNLSNEKLYNEYYSDSIINNNKLSISDFVLPDKKQLPSLVIKQ